MAKTKTKGTTAKIKELKGIKTEKVTEEQLNKIKWQKTQQKRLKN